MRGSRGLLSYKLSVGGINVALLVKAGTRGGEGEPDQCWRE